MDKLIRQRVCYLLLAIVVIPLGLGTRRYRESLPTIVVEYGGDTLWALMLYLLVSAILVGHSLPFRAGISLLLTFAVEISQLYEAPWIDHLRETTLGGLVLGFGFLWSDLICYSAGIALGAFGEWSLVRVIGQRLGRSSVPKVESQSTPETLPSTGSE